ncbi:MAG: hypothetical protein ACJ8H8_30885 [Geminicoccaceae bacterium]
MSAAPQHNGLAGGDVDVYGLAALARACAAIRDAAFGEQERTLNAECFSIGTLVGADRLDKGTARAELLAASRDMPSEHGRDPWVPRDLERKVDHALHDGMQNPRAEHPQTRPGARKQPPRQQQGQQPVHAKANGTAQPKANGEAQPEPRIVETYDYRDEVGGLLFQVVRYEPKAFRQRRPNGLGQWVWNLDGIERVPYRLPELLAAPSPQAALRRRY